MAHAYESERGRAVLARMNAIHGALRRFLPRGRRPLLRTAMTQRTYRKGYTIETLGP